MMNNVCVVKTCTCANGASATGVNCVSHGASSCVGGDYDQSGNFKSCFCNAGVAANGAACPTHGSRFCLSCNAGYTLVNNTCQPNNCNVVNSCGTNFGGSGDYNQGSYGYNTIQYNSFKKLYYCIVFEISQNLLCYNCNIGYYHTSLKTKNILVKIRILREETTKMSQFVLIVF